MKILNNIMKGLGLAVVGISLLAGQAKAASFTFENGDLMLGFYSTSTSKPNEYVIDLGRVANLQAGLLGNIKADLDSIDSGWATDTSFRWGGFGSANPSQGTVPGEVDNTLWTTKVKDAVTPLYRMSDTSQSGPAGLIFGTGISVQANGTPGSSSLENAIESKSVANSFKNKAPFQISGGGVTQYYKTTDTDFGWYLDLYKLVPDNDTSGTQSGDILGYFTLATNGDLSYTEYSVPDAGSTLSLLGLAMMGVAMLRRRLS
jgi:hypothetical protein